MNTRLVLVKQLDRTPNRLDWATVEQALSANGNDNESRTLKFQRLILDKLFGIPLHESNDHVTDGGDDCGIDCFYTDYNNNKIHLITTKTVDAFDKAKKNFPGVEVSKLICFVRDFVSHAETLLTRCNPLLRAKVNDAWEAMSAGRVFLVCVHVCSNQTQLIERDAKVLREGLAEYRANVFEHPLTRLSDEVSRNWIPPVSKTLSFQEKGLFEHLEDEGHNSNGVRSLIGCVRARELATFLCDKNSGFVDENLFHANVRGHLGVQNPVNQEIAATLRGDSRTRFFFLNNGITIACENYLYQSGGFPVTLHRPQIVNGRQTAETIFTAYRQDPASLGDVAVFVRVVQTTDPAFVEEVSVATNNQSRIGSRDLRANSTIARKLASGLDRHGYYYVRKRGERSPLSPEKTIDALKAAQLILAFARGQPEKAKTNTASMFGDDFDSVFDPQHITPEILITAHRLFLDIEQEKHRAMLTMRQSGLSAASAEHWLVEGAFHVLFCVPLLAGKQGVDLIDYDACKLLVPNAMEIVGKYFDSIERMAAYRLFRSVRARDDLRKIISGDAASDFDGTRQLRLAL